MDALIRRQRVKYSRHNARIDIPYHVLERLIARDLKLQQIELPQEPHTENQSRSSFPVCVDAEYINSEKHFAEPVMVWPDKVSVVHTQQGNVRLHRIHVRIGDNKFSIELHY